MLSWAVLFTASAQSGCTTLDDCWRILDYSPTQRAWLGASQPFNLCGVFVSVSHLWSGGVAGIMSVTVPLVIYLRL